MERTRRLIDYYLPPDEGFVLESLVATTYEVNFEFLEEELLASALGVRSSTSRVKAFRSELERRLQKSEVSVLYDLGGSQRLARLSPRIDAIPISARKLHSKISLLMWIRDNVASSAPADRRMRLIVGSANLTRQGFRQNYECVVSADFGGRSASPRILLTKAIALLRQIGAESQAPQLQRQLASFEAQAAILADETPSADDPVALVAGDEVVPSIRSTWAAVSKKAPQTVTVVSPFWTTGSTASEALFQLFQELGPPGNVELVCRGEKSGGGETWLPVFDGAVALELKNRLSSRLFLRATLPDVGLIDSSASEEEIGDELEENEFATRLGTEKRSTGATERALHAKMILLDGTTASVLYVGSSNCTRRGLGLGGPLNHEAGLVYRLTPRQRKQITGLLEFAGPACEVSPDALPETVQPPPEAEIFVPTFLDEVVASGSIITIRFRDTLPIDLVLLMPIPTKAGGAGYWLLYPANDQSEASPETLTLDLAACQRCNECLEPLSSGLLSEPVLPHVFIEARWEGHSATFPVRFDDKARLPLLLLGRKATEGEIIEYFLFGREPDEGNDGSGLQGETNGHPTDAPIDTRRILSYFIRRFVQAIAGIETEVGRAAHSRASLDAALRGPTSPLELAERAYASVAFPPSSYEPVKTPTAVGFQLVEILAALNRCQSRVPDAELNGCFLPVLTRCEEMLRSLIAEHSELRSEVFRNYRARILEDAG